MQLHVFSIPSSSSLEYMQGAWMEPNEHITLTPAAVSGLLAIPVMAGSSAYALSDTFGWKQGLDKKFKQAKAFYLVIAASTIIGLDKFLKYRLN